ncbi:MAG: SusF/SusE family outer membrane protein [Bacteroidales bacterium]
MNKFRKMLKLAGVALLVFATMAACKKDDPTPVVPDVILDGLYITGAVTPFSSTLVAGGMMKKARNEVTQAERATLYELYIPLKAGTTGFNIVKVAGSVQTTYGPTTNWGVITAGTTDEPKSPFQRGVVAVNSSKFTVPADGMYHVAIDMELMKAVIVPVHWGIIGAATPGGWSNSTPLPDPTFNQAAMAWTITNLKLQKGEWKFRYSDGWKVELDTVLVVGTGKIGVKINTNFGGAVSALVPGGDNIVNSAPGFYTISMAYAVGGGFHATTTKTGDIPLINYSAYQMGIIGNAYYKSDGVTVASWDENFGTSLPVITNVSTYTWTYTLNMIAGEFKFRQGTDWAGKSIGYGDVTMAGPAAANFSNNGGNFKLDIVGNYTLVLKIDAATEVYTVTATKN